MELTPKLYHLFVRPRFMTDLYINKLIRKKFDLENKKVLDFGCGIGSSSYICSPDNYLGIDPDSERVDYAQRIYPNHTFRILEEKQLPLTDGSIDYVLIVAVLHHIPSAEIQLYLQEFKRILKQHGKVIVIEPYLDNNCRFNKRLMSFFDNGKYIRNEKDYLGIFKSNSFQTDVHNKYKRFFYNEIFFSACPN
jgi:ubiquinone/menaquinone biosynthesis C-methylase UbiE